jgi:hypothetical protein
MFSVANKPFMLNAIMLSVIMLSVVMLSVVMLSVMAPLKASMAPSTINGTKSEFFHYSAEFKFFMSNGLQMKSAQQCECKQTNIIFQILLTPKRDQKND